MPAGATAGVAAAVSVRRPAGAVPAALGGCLGIGGHRRPGRRGARCAGRADRYAVLNAADPGDNRIPEATAALADFPQLTLLDAPIRRRKAFANATGQGVSVDELVPLDAKASAELAALVSKAFPIVHNTIVNGG